MKPKKILSLLLTVCLLASSLALTGCDWNKATRPLNTIGYNVQVALLAAGRAAKEVSTCNAKPAPTALLDSLKKTSLVAEDWSKRIDGLIEINPQTKVELINLTDSLAAQLASTLALLRPDDVKLQERLLIVRAFIAAASLTIATLDVTRPVSTASVKVKVKDAADKSVKAGTRDANQTICVVNALGDVASKYTADVLAQKGLDTASLHNLRLKKFSEVQAL